MTNSNSQGKFITLEGGEGSGKSTAIQSIETWLTEQNIDFISTREPGGTPMAEEIRALFLNHREETVHDLTELLLVFAARVQHIKEKIKPALAAGKWVICDRFIDSTYVYQGIARKGDMSKIDALASWVLVDCQPDMTLLFDVPVEIGLQRVDGRNKKDRLDAESQQFHQMIRDGFLARAKDNANHRVIDASQSLEKVQQDLLNILQTLL